MKNKCDTTNHPLGYHSELITELFQTVDIRPPSQFALTSLIESNKHPPIQIISTLAKAEQLETQINSPSINQISQLNRSLANNINALSWEEQLPISKRSQTKTQNESESQYKRKPHPIKKAILKKQLQMSTFQYSPNTNELKPSLNKQILHLQQQIKDQLFQDQQSVASQCNQTLKTIQQYLPIDLFNEITSKLIYYKKIKSEAQTPTPYFKLDPSEIKVDQIIFFCAFILSTGIFKKETISCYFEASKQKSSLILEKQLFCDLSEALKSEDLILQLPEIFRNQLKNPIEKLLFPKETIEAQSIYLFDHCLFDFKASKIILNLNAETHSEAAITSELKQSETILHQNQISLNQIKQEQISKYENEIKLIPSQQNRNVPQFKFIFSSKTFSLYDIQPQQSEQISQNQNIIMNNQVNQPLLRKQVEFKAIRETKHSCQIEINPPKKVAIFKQIKHPCTVGNTIQIQSSFSDKSMLPPRPTFSYRRNLQKKILLRKIAQSNQTILNQKPQEIPIKGQYNTPKEKQKFEEQLFSFIKEKKTDVKFLKIFNKYRPLISVELLDFDSIFLRAYAEILYSTCIQIFLQLQQLHLLISFKETLLTIIKYFIEIAKKLKLHEQINDSPSNQPNLFSNSLCIQNSSLKGGLLKVSKKQRRSNKIKKSKTTRQNNKQSSVSEVRDTFERSEQLYPFSLGLQNTEKTISFDSLCFQTRNSEDEVDNSPNENLSVPTEDLGRIASILNQKKYNHEVEKNPIHSLLIDEQSHILLLNSLNTSSNLPQNNQN